jgi:hypothetical protein
MENAMSPGQAAKEVGVTYAIAKRYYEKWAPEIQPRLEGRLVSDIQESIKRLRKKKSGKNHNPVEQLSKLGNNRSLER